jgi:DNA-binding IclR family transcriptional regulator
VEGGFLGALGVVAPRTRYDPRMAAALGEEVRQAAERLSRRIGGSADAAHRLTPR